MKGVTVIRNPSIKIDLTADDWWLYSGEDYPYRDSVTVSLNRGIEDILNTSNDFYSQREKKQRCWNLLEQYKGYGAADSEGGAVLDNILREFFGPEYYRG